MSPLDDELRAALSGRAQAVAPAPDPLDGIERRAKQIRRTRIGAAVAGSALAVALVAAVVPAVQSATSSGPPRGTEFAATPEPSPAVEQSPYALDPADPWAFRGTPVDDGSRATIQGEYATKRQAEKVLLTPLFSQVYEPSQQQEVVFVAEVDGAYRWGVAQYTEAGPEFLWDEPLPEPALALAAALPGDEGPRLLVVASPDTTALRYSSAPPGEGDPMALLAPGVGTTALEGDLAQDSYRVLLPNEERVIDAPDPRSEQPAAETASAADIVAYELDVSEPWGFRGPGDPAELAGEDVRLFEQNRTARAGQGWSNSVLYGAESDEGVEYLVALHTAPGQEPVVTTTYRVDDVGVRQFEQVVRDGQLLIQTFLPTSRGNDGSVLHIALASPRAGGIVLEQGDRPQPGGTEDPGVGRWLMNAAEVGTGRILLYTQGDGREYHAEAVRVP